MTGEPTPTPWAWDKGDIGEDTGAATAALIVRAVNAHEDMVKQLSDMVNAIDAGAVHITSEEIGGGSPCGDPPHPWHEEWLSNARDALALALAGETP